MERQVSSGLRIAGIVGLALVLTLSGGFFLLATMCGGFQEPQLLPFMVVALLIAGGAVFGIAVLTRRLTLKNVPGAAPAVVDLGPRDLAREAEALVYLRATLLTRVGLSLAILLQHQVQAARGAGPAQSILSAVLVFVIYQFPFAALAWRLWDRLERLAVWLAFAYAAVGAAWSLYNVARFASYYRESHTNITLVALPILAELAVAVTAWRARQALPPEPDQDKGILAFVVAGAYTVIATSATTVIYRILSSR